ncbi:MAG: hypothetical protein ACRDTG_28885 [Pseudonocardiaceae bacterium]
MIRSTSAARSACVDLDGLLQRMLAELRSEPLLVKAVATTGCVSRTQTC